MKFSFNSPLHYWNSIGPEAHLTAHLHPLPSRAIPPYPVQPNPTIPRHITYIILPHPIPSYLISSDHITSHLITSHLISSDRLIDLTHADWSALLCITLLYFVLFVVPSPSLSSIPVSFIRFISKIVVSH
jgi:hypothetical protein